MLFLTLPLLALLANVDPRAIKLTDPEVLQAVRLSLLTSGLAVLLGVLVGTPLAYTMARTRFRGHALLETLLDLPMVLPPTVAGIALLLAYGRHLHLAFTTAAVVVAQLFVATPFFLKSAQAGFAEVPRDLEEAAAVDGAAPFQVFWHVTLPLARTALFTGALLMWARALGEFGATIIFAGNLPGTTQTLPLAIYVGFELNLETALACSLILLVLSVAVLLAARVLNSR